MFKLTTGSVYARPFHLSFHVILITILLNSIAIKIKSNSCMLSVPTQISGIEYLKARFHPSSPFWVSSSLLYLHIFKSVLKNMEACLIKRTAKCSDIQEKSTALDKTVTGWPFADMSKLAFTAQIQDVGKNTDFLFQKSRSCRPDFRAMYKHYFHSIRERAITNETKVLQGLRCPGFSSRAVAVSCSAAAPWGDAPSQACHVCWGLANWPLAQQINC